MTPRASEGPRVPSGTVTPGSQSEGILRLQVSRCRNRQGAKRPPRQRGDCPSLPRSARRTIFDDHRGTLVTQNRFICAEVLGAAVAGTAQPPPSRERSPLPGSVFPRPPPGASGALCPRLPFPLFLRLLLLSPSVSLIPSCLHGASEPRDTGAVTSAVVAGTCFLPWAVRSGCASSRAGAGGAKRDPQGRRAVGTLPGEAGAGWSRT